MENYERILVTGASGQVGHSLLRMLDDGSHEVYAASVARPVARTDNVRPVQADFCRAGAAETLVRQIEPSTVVHLAVSAGSRAAGQEDAVRRQVNVGAVAEISRAAKAVGARVIFASSDMVFSGRRGAYTEDDAPDPICEYGREKLAAEKSLDCDRIVLRLPLLFGPTECFFAVMLAKFARGERVRCFYNEFRTPLFVDDAARAIRTIVAEKNWPKKRLLHLPGPEKASRLGLATLACEVFGYDPRLIAAESSRREFADRPEDVSLVSLYLKAAFPEIEFRNLREALEFMKTHEAAKPDIHP